MTLSSEGYHFCPIDKSDPMAQAALLEVYTQCEDFLALGPQANASSQMVLADLEAAIIAGRQYLGIVILPSEQMIGVIDFLHGGLEGEPQCAFLELLMIARPFRNRGLGRQIVADFEAKIRNDRHITAIRLGVQENNPGALRFWQRSGYKIIRPARLQPDHTIAYLLEKLV
jgi:ribosomal protein S18 acetylase RimI-like enzyme